MSSIFESDEDERRSSSSSSSSSDKQRNADRWNNVFELFRSTDWTELDMSEVIANWNQCLYHPEVRGNREVREKRMHCRPVEIDQIEKLVKAMCFPGVDEKDVQQAFQHHLNLDWKAFVRKMGLWKDAAGLVPVIFRPHKLFKYVPDCPHPALNRFQSRHNSTGTIDLRVRPLTKHLSTDKERIADAFQTNEQFISRERAIREAKAVRLKLFEEQVRRTGVDTDVAMVEAAASSKRGKKRKEEKEEEEEGPKSKQKLEALPPVAVEHQPGENTITPYEQLMQAQDTLSQFETVHTFVFDEPMFQPLNFVSYASSGFGVEVYRLVPSTVQQTIRVSLEFFKRMEALRLRSAEKAVTDSLVVESTVGKEAKAMMIDGGLAAAHMQTDVVQQQVLAQMRSTVTPQGGGGEELSEAALNQRASAAATRAMFSAVQTQVDTHAQMASMEQHRRNQLNNLSGVNVMRLEAQEKPYFPPFKDAVPESVEYMQYAKNLVCKLMGVPDQLVSHAEVSRNTKTRSSGPDDTTERVFVDSVCNVVFALKDVMEKLLSMIWEKELTEAMEIEVTEARKNKVPGADKLDVREMVKFSGRITVVWTSLFEPAFLQHALDIGMLDEIKYARWQAASFLFPSTLLRDYPTIPLFTSQGHQQGLLEAQMETERAAFDAAIEPLPAGGGGGGSSSSSKGKKKAGGGGGGKPAMKRGKPPATGLFGSNLVKHTLGPGNKARMQQSAMNRTKKDLKNAPSVR
jgi:hypothetical protein